MSSNVWGISGYATNRMQFDLISGSSYLAPHTYKINLAYAKHTPCSVVSRNYTKTPSNMISVCIQYASLHIYQYVITIYYKRAYLPLQACATDNIDINLTSVSSSIRIIAQTFSISLNSTRRFGGVAFHTQLTTTRHKIYYSRVWLM